MSTLCMCRWSAKPSRGRTGIVWFTMPTRTGDPATNALYHLSLLKPGPLCVGRSGGCRDVCHLHQHVFSSQVPPARPRICFGHTLPCAQHRAKQGGDRFVEAWKSYEALQLSRAEAAWAKLHKERKVGVLNDVATWRSWYLAGTEQETMIQTWLMPWLQGSYRHVYHGPWPAVRRKGLVNPLYARKDFLQWHSHGKAYLPALPLKAAVHIVRFLGHVYGEDGAQIIVADSVEAQRAAVRLAPVAGSRVFTGTGRAPWTRSR